jgi:hypothetical protein
MMGQKKHTKKTTLNVPKTKYLLRAKYDQTEPKARPKLKYVRAWQ